MPSRWMRWLIVGFWAATTAWLFWHDLWPSWRPGEPPPFHIDPVEEVRKGEPMRTFWTVQRQKSGEAEPSPVFRASTWVDSGPDDDTYALHARLDATRDPKLQPLYEAKVFKIDLVTSAYSVNRRGQLRSLEATVKATPHFERLDSEVLPLLRPLLPAPRQRGPGASPSADPLSLRIWGEVHDEQFFAHCRASANSLTKPLQFDLPPTAVSHTGSVLMPLHPVNHIRGLRLGQSWRQPLVDPIRDAFAALSSLSGGVRALNARVLSQAETLILGDSQTSCLVIEYTDDDNEIRGRTWVERDSERVQQQEAFLDEDRWILRRDALHRSARRVLER
jgi:hypothetical protein